MCSAWVQAFLNAAQAALLRQEMLSEWIQRRRSFHSDTLMPSFSPVLGSSLMSTGVNAVLTTPSPVQMMWTLYWSNGKNRAMACFTALVLWDTKGNVKSIFLKVNNVFKYSCVQLVHCFLDTFFLLYHNSFCSHFDSHSYKFLCVFTVLYILLNKKHVVYEIWCRWIHWGYKIGELQLGHLQMGLP